jgi:ABC-type bacteriocin/lantibiotic exporter with double-glycine peptidase domain
MTVNKLDSLAIRLYNWVLIKIVVVIFIVVIIFFSIIFGVSRKDAEEIIADANKFITSLVSEPSYKEDEKK